MSVFSLISANMEVILRRISTLSDDRLISTVSAATCLDAKGLGSRVGVAVATLLVLEHLLRVDRLS